MFKQLVFVFVCMLLLQSPVLAATVEIKVAHGSPATDDKLEESAQVMRKYVEEKSKGSLKMTTFPNAQLGSERENMEGLQLGTIEMAIITTGPVAGIYPEIMVLDLPYLVPV